MAENDSTLKRCPRCQSLKPKSIFYNSAKSKDGKAGYCIPCAKEKSVEWQKENPQRKKDFDRAHKSRPEIKDKEKVRSRKRYESNPDLFILRLKAWNKANPEASKLRQARFKAKNPEKVAAIQKKYHCTNEVYRKNIRLRGQVSWALKRERKAKGSNSDNGNLITRLKWIKILDAFDNACCYCGSKDFLTIEHLTPLSKGGDNQVGNIAPACMKCNRKKWHTPLEEFTPNANRIRRIASLK